MMKNKRRHEKRIFDYLGTITVNFDPQISTLPLMNNKQITKENKTNDDDPDVFAKGGTLILFRVNFQLFHD